MKNKLTLVDKKMKTDEKIAWEEVKHYFAQVKTLDEVNEKFLIRSGKHMRSAILNLLYAITKYNQVRGEE
jgi:hypothetical protein